MKPQQTLLSKPIRTMMLSLWTPLFLLLLVAIGSPRIATAARLIPVQSNRQEGPAPSCHDPPHPGIDWEGFTFGLNGVQTDFMWLDAIKTDDDDGDDDGDDAAHSRSPSRSRSYSCSPESCLVPVGPLALPPSATVLNYGQGLFEGLKAVRRTDGSIAVFRPDRNALRMGEGADRLLLPPVPEATFLAAIDAVVRSNARWVPPCGNGALYLRPLLLGTGPKLGVGPSPESTFCVYCSPVGNYFRGKTDAAATGTGTTSTNQTKTSSTSTSSTSSTTTTTTTSTTTSSTTTTSTTTLKPIRLLAVRGFGRAAAGGSGNVKAAGNYAPAFAVQKEVKRLGCDEVLCLDASTGETIEEAGASNFFAVFPNRTIVTPSLDSGTILPGVTRASILELAREECGCDVLETPALRLSDLAGHGRGHGHWHGATEAFCCGTGASVTPVGSIRLGYNNYNNNRNHNHNHSHNHNHRNEDDENHEKNGPIVAVFGDGTSPGPITKKLHQLLMDLQLGTDPVLNEKYKDWIHVVPPNPAAPTGRPAPNE